MEIDRAFRGKDILRLGFRHRDWRIMALPAFECQPLAAASETTHKAPTGKLPVGAFEGAKSCGLPAGSGNRLETVNDRADFLQVFLFLRGRDPVGHDNEFV